MALTRAAFVSVLAIPVLLMQTRDGEWRSHLDPLIPSRMLPCSTEDERQGLPGEEEVGHLQGDNAERHGRPRPPPRSRTAVRRGMAAIWIPEAYPIGGAGDGSGNGSRTMVPAMDQGYNRGSRRWIEDRIEDDGVDRDGRDMDPPGRIHEMPEE